MSDNIGKVQSNSSRIVALYSRPSVCCIILTQVGVHVDSNGSQQYLVTGLNEGTGTSLWSLQEEEAVQRLTERMKAVLGPFVLRRLKSEVASQLTAKQHHEELVAMTSEQSQLYQTAVQELKAEVSTTAKGALKSEIPLYDWQLC